MVAILCDSSMILVYTACINQYHAALQLWYTELSNESINKIPSGTTLILFLDPPMVYVQETQICAEW